MKHELYKTLSEEEKEEYNLKFTNMKIYNDVKLTIVMCLTSLLIFMMVGVLFGKEGLMNEELAKHLLELSYFAFNIMRVVIVFEIAFTFARILKLVEEMMWTRKILKGRIK